MSHCPALSVGDRIAIVLKGATLVALGRDHIYIRTAGGDYMWIPVGALGASIIRMTETSGASDTPDPGPAAVSPDGGPTFVRDAHQPQDDGLRLGRAFPVRPQPIQDRALTTQDGGDQS